MSVRVLIVALGLFALAFSGLLYWQQVYAYYEDLPPQATYALAAPDGVREVAVEGFEGIDATSSPIRYRACFRVADGDGGAADLVPYPEPEPRTAPGWFDCFEADVIGAALEAGEARAVLSERDVTWGIDRVVAMFPDGRAFAWHQINPCGAVVFRGEPAPEGCPPVPEGLT